MKRALVGASSSSSFLRQQHASASLHPAALFHSTAALLDRTRRYSHRRLDGYPSRFGRKEGKRTKLRGIDLYLEHILHGSKISKHDNPQDTSSGYTSWFEKQHFSKGRKKIQFCNWEFQRRNNANKKQRPSHFFCEDTDGEKFKTTFGSSSGEDQGFHQSFHRRGFSNRSMRYGKRHPSDGFSNQSTKYGQRHPSGGFSNQSTRYGQRHSSQNWKRESGEGNQLSAYVSERLTLGLATSGHLKLNDVKNAYRVCALQWHPDRHQGSSKETISFSFGFFLRKLEQIEEHLSKVFGQSTTMSALMSSTSATMKVWTTYV